jgi:molybdopterin-containing oxidoreductase family iron-sulfur binding subunit
MDKKRLDLAAARARLTAMKGKEYWRSLDELAETEEFKEFLHREFPDKAADLLDPVSRRSFLKVMSASLALAGLNACSRQPDEKIVPYAAEPPEKLIPGEPLFYATAFRMGGFAYGVLAESHMGRPVKIEGNALHPASLGSTDIFSQASILDLYDPDRAQVVTRNGQINTWETFQSVLRETLNAQAAKQGSGLRILTTTVTSPTLAFQIQGLLERFPEAKWHQYDPVGRSNARKGAELAFGEPVETIYRIDRAEVILGLDSDFMSWGPAALRYSKDFARKRAVSGGRARMNRLYAVESTPTITGTMADHRLPLRPTAIEPFVEALARRLGLDVETAEHPDLEGMDHWIDALARDLTRNRGHGVVIPGEPAAPRVHALAHAINGELGNAGRTLVHTDPVEAGPTDQLESLRDLVRDMEAGAVEALIVLGGNPAFTSPADLKFVEACKTVGYMVYLGQYEDETARLCNWHIPEAHDLEAWSDARAYDGTATIIQPLIAPLYQGRSAHELLAAVSGKGGVSGHDVVREYWKSQGLNTEEKWQTAIHDGIVPGTAFDPKSVTLRAAGIRRRETSPPSLEVAFRPDPSIWDGQYANNGWLQELPKPLTKLTWDNAALVSPKTAQRLGLSNEDVVQLSTGGLRVEAPVWILPGQPDECVTLNLGYGRTRAGRVGTGAGFNAYALRTSNGHWSASNVEITRTGRRYRLASTQHHHLMEGRHLVRHGTVDEYNDDPHFVHHGHHSNPDATLYPGFPYEGYAWGMSIDLNACNGCNACVIGCQSENNIPIVGKKEVRNGREMHWIRVDRYYSGSMDNPDAYFQPLNCMHCENAPCEVVCPVAATVHSDEGLNDMIYNRCVGTRYCANNCPYKVRRFNFLQYVDQKSPSLKLLNNPDVTVRMRGIMEKCTYCVQRINAARIEAKKENRDIRDGEIQPACQAACPTEAIVFGDINNEKSRVSKSKAEPRSYGILEELNTNPRTTYLARLRNPNPELEETHGGSGHEATPHARTRS